MDKAIVVKFKDYLLNNLKMHGEYDAAAGLRKKVLMVEGTTDKAFFKRIICNDTRCMAVEELMRSKSAFSTSRTPSAFLYNSKVVIITILKHIAYYPEYYDFPRGAEKWPLYGIVDNDFDGMNELTRVTKLFFTDTHDLETLMLSSDMGLLTRLESCIISPDVVKAALFIANQLAAFRQAIKRNGNLTLAGINDPDGTIDYKSFTEGDIIDLTKLLKHINNHSEKPLSNEKIKRIRDSIAKNMHKQLNNEGFWKKSLDSFVVSQDSDFWMDVNGHDILSAICYKMPILREIFNNSSGHDMNRDFEFALSSAYDYNCLKTTTLYKKLKDANLLKDD